MEFVSLFVSGVHASCAFLLQTDSLSSSDLEELDGDAHVVESAGNDQYVSTNTRLLSLLRIGSLTHTHPISMSTSPTDSHISFSSS